MTKDQIIAEASILPDDERIDIMEELLHTFDADAALSVAWRDEVVRRRDALRAGTASSRPAHDVIGRLRARAAR